MTYQEVLDWIHRKLKFGIKPGLERMKWMLSQLGDPQHKLSAVHVVGTNGKGSTVNYLQHIFREAGYSVGTFTSPYILEFRERITFNGQMISEAELIKTVKLVKPIVDRLPLETDLEAATEFEVITLVMFAYFGLINPVDIVFIEAGLGGRYDSTNVFQALAVVCPSIGLDHQNILGDTYTEIANQKVGVLKGGEPFLYATSREDVREVFRIRGQEKNALLLEYEQQFNITKEGHQLTFVTENHRISDISLPMPGSHQVSNAALAIMTSLVLSESYPLVTDSSIRTGLKKATWIGRTQLIGNNILVDGAHNKESIQALSKVLIENYGSKTFHFLFAAIDTKPVEAMLSDLDQLGDVTVTQFDYPNSLAIEKYPKSYRRLSDYQMWLQEIDQTSVNDFYVITGSLYFISQVLPHLDKIDTQ